MSAFNAKPLSHQQLAFVDELMLDPARIPSRAYSRVFGVAGQASVTGACSLMRDGRIVQEIAERNWANMERNQLSVDRLTQHLVDLVEADPRELSEYHRGACRYCYGEKHRYQFTPGELERAVEAYKKSNEAAQHKRGIKPLYDPMALFFDYKGGVGFDLRRSPHPECPECFGKGVGYEHVNDTRELSAQAARLYSGVDKTKEGLKIKTRSQDKMLELALRVSGMLSEKPEEEPGDTPAVSVTYAMQDASDPNGPANPMAGPPR